MTDNCASVPARAGSRDKHSDREVALDRCALEARAKAKASGDYDDKIDLLYAAFRKEARLTSIKPGPQGERYEPWIVHAHYSSSLSDAAPMRVHMKRNVEKDWRMELPAYHSRPLNQDTFKLVEREALRLSTVAQRGL